MKKELLLLVSIFLLVIGLGVYFLFTPTSSGLSYQPIDVGGGSITVENQPDDLATVTLDAELAAPGWITIHESVAGAPGPVIGTSIYLDEGSHESLVIQLSEEMSPGFRYITLLHADNGDKSFEILEDLPVEVDGVVVRPDFVAGREPGDEGTTIDIPGTEDTLELTPNEE